MKFGCQSEVLKKKKKNRERRNKTKGMTDNNGKGKCDVALPR